MPTRTFLSVTVCLLLGMACAPAPTEEPESAVGKVEDASAVGSLRQSYEAAENAGDAAAVAELWAADGVLMPAHAPAVEGREAIQAFYAGQFEQGKVDISINDEEAVMSGNWGFGRGAYSLQVTMADGGTLEDQGKYISIVARQPDGGVKISRLIFNSDLPMPGAPGA